MAASARIVAIENGRLSAKYRRYSAAGANGKLSMSSRAQVAWLLSPDLARTLAVACARNLAPPQEAARAVSTSAYVDAGGGDAEALVAPARAAGRAHTAAS